MDKSRFIELIGWFSHTARSYVYWKKNQIFLSISRFMHLMLMRPAFAVLSNEKLHLPECTKIEFEDHPSAESLQLFARMFLSVPEFYRLLNFGSHFQCTLAADPSFWSWMYNRCRCTIFSPLIWENFELHSIWHCLCHVVTFVGLAPVHACFWMRENSY